MYWDTLHDPAEYSRRQFRGRDVQAIIIFGGKKVQPAYLDIPEHTAVLYLDDLLDSLPGRDPASPLLPVFAPLTEGISQLETNASQYYGEIQNCQSIDEHARETLLTIFKHFLYQRFDQKTSKEFQAMIATLTPLRETQVAKEFIEEGRQEGRHEGHKEIVLNLWTNGMSPEQIAKSTGIPIAQVQDYLEDS